MTASRTRNAPPSCVKRSAPIRVLRTSGAATGSSATAAAAGAASTAAARRRRGVLLRRREGAAARHRAPVHERRVAARRLYAVHDDRRRRGRALGSLGALRRRHVALALPHPGRRGVALVRAPARRDLVHGRRALLHLLQGRLGVIFARCGRLRYRCHGLHDGRAVARPSAASRTDGAVDDADTRVEGLMGIAWRAPRAASRTDGARPETAGA